MQDMPFWQFLDSVLLLQKLCKEHVETSLSAILEPEDSFGFRRRNNLNIMHVNLIKYALQFV